MISNKIFSTILAVAVSVTALSFTASAASYYASDENGNTSIPDYIESVEVSSEGVSIPEEAENNTYELTPDGNLSLIDDYTEESDGDDITQKQFLTVTTKSGNTFYIVVDRNGETDNVYLLNLVDEADLMALINDEEVSVESTSETGSDTGKTTGESEVTESLEEESGKTNAGPIIIIVIVLAGGGFAYYWFKMRKNPNKKESVDTIDYDDIDTESEETYANEEENNDE